jgi:hypothetical protein
MARTFIRHMRETGEGGGDTTWLDPLIGHVYGPEAAALLGRTPT